MDARRNSSYLPSIQLGRGLAAVLVLLYHSTAAAFGIGSRYVFWGGAAGVDIFFVISGFIIAYVSRNDSAKNFVLKRAIRILPPYYFYTSIVVAILIVAPSLYANLRFQWSFVLSSYLLMLSRSNAGDIGVALGVGWTLAYEVYFYVLTALGLLARRGRGWILVSAVILTGAAISPFVNAPAPLTPALTALPVEFLAGVYLAQLHFAQYRLPPSIGWGFIVLGIAAIVYAGSIQAVGGIFYNPARIIWYGLPAVAVVAGLLSVDRGFSFPRPLLRLGDISYSLYLSHPFVVEGVKRVTGPLGIPPLVQLGIFIVAAVAVAECSYRLIEVPSTNVLSRMLGLRNPRPAARAQ